MPVTPTQPLDVICVGAPMVDFLPAAPGKSVRDVDTWHRCPGGAPANVAIGLARLGASSALNGVAGDDEFGQYLRRQLAEEGVDVSHLRLSSEGRTGLSFVSLTRSGERSFSFYRDNAAEQLFGPQDVDAPFISRSRIVHFGLNSFRRPEARNAVLAMVDAAASAGRIVSCDPNLRLHLWEQPADVKTLIDAVLGRCTVVKLASDEIEFVLGTANPEAALHALAALGVALPVITCGDRGALFLHAGKVHQVGAPSVAVVDTTGAGDGFSAGMLYALSRLAADASSLRAARLPELIAAAELGCRIGSHAVQRLGAVAGLPLRTELAGDWPNWLGFKPAALAV